MNTFLRIALLIVLLSLLSHFGAAQQELLSPGSVPKPGVFLESHSVSFSDSVVRLEHAFVKPGSEHLVLDSATTLRRDEDYVIDYTTGTVHFLGRERYFHGAAEQGVLAVRYQTFPIDLKTEYALRRLEVLRDTSGAVRRVVQPVTAPFALGDVFGPGLQKSGSIVRGLTVASNRDLTLNSGFRLQLTGNLAENLEVVAALTDENSPIQPEGTTQTLQEVDQVFVQLKHPHYGVTLGDFNLEVGKQEGGEFGQVFRKLQGAQAAVQLGAQKETPFGINVALTAGAPRGKYTSNYFQGQEGNQGPFQLTGSNGERRIIVIAGTERVYVNGERMTRGETNDYTIDYASAELTFSSRRLITSASRITVDFEYADRHYERNVLSAAISGGALGNRVRFGATLLQEADDPDAPIDVELNDTSRAILAASGADRFKASMPGYHDVGRDSATGLGLGQYRRVDTLIAGRVVQAFVYAPANPEAVYTVSFAYVEQMPPDSLGYQRVRVGEFVVAGVGQGNYLPLALLPLPQRQQLAALSVSSDITKELSVAGEFAVSSFDQNRLSTLDNTGKTGQAGKIAFQYKPRGLQVGGVRLGDLDFTLSDRFVNAQFRSADRFNEVEFGRKWNLPSETTTTTEEIREVALRYVPVPRLSLTGTYGVLDRKGAYRSDRVEADGAYTDSTVADAHYHVASISSQDLSSDFQSTWLRQRGSVGRSFAGIEASVGFEAEDRRAHASGSDSLLPGSFRFLEIGPSVGLPLVGPLSLDAGVAIRNDDSTLAGTLQRALMTRTERFGLHLREWNSVTSSVAVNLRQASYTEAFRLRGNGDVQTMLVRAETRVAPYQRAVQADLYYEFANQRSARYERVFVRVAQGTGNYRYLGDLNGDGIAEEDEFELTRYDGDYVVVLVPGDVLVPVVDLKSSVRVRLQPSRFLPPSSGLALTILRSLSAETYARVDERSTDPRTSNLYLLRLSTFQNASTTLSGSNQFRQDLYVLENDPTVSVRLRYDSRKGFVQLLSGGERSLFREQSIRLRLQPMTEAGGQLDFALRRDRVGSAVPSPRERDLHLLDFSSDIFYRPTREWEVGFRLGGETVEDTYGGESAQADLNSQGLRVVRAFTGRGQLRTEVTREEVVLTRPYRNSGKVLPYEFTGGRVIGKTFLWTVSVDYRLDQHVQLSVAYDGRSEGRRSPIHTARAEARAFF